MPPRKSSDVSKVVTGDEETPTKEVPGKEGINVDVCDLPYLLFAGSAADARPRVMTNEELYWLNWQDLNLPKSIVTRLAKGVLPPNTQIQGNAMLAMTKSATVFVNYLATQYVPAVRNMLDRGQALVMKDGIDG
jgi:DNA polymerase epsilon subunit 3